MKEKRKMESSYKYNKIVMRNKIKQRNKDAKKKIDRKNFVYFVPQFQLRLFPFTSPWFMSDYEFD